MADRYRSPAARAGRQITRPSDVTNALIGATVRRHARLQPNGDPMLCTPSREEIARPTRRRENAGSDYKPIYDTQQAAELAARALHLEAGYPPLYAYECRRSRHGHYHLTSNPNPGIRRALPGEVS
jgi:hypothetical protein